MMDDDEEGYLPCSEDPQIRVFEEEVGDGSKTDSLGDALGSDGVLKLAKTAVKAL